MSEIIKLSAFELSKKLEAKEVSAVEVAQAHLDRISAVDENINAFLAVSETIVAEAENVDQLRAKGEHAGALAGVPVAVKDVLVTKELPTTASSKMLAGYQSPFDATVVEKIKQAGMLVLGKTNMDEFAMGSTTETSAFGVTRNPWDVSRVPGGSGGGSAAALAAFEAPLAFGSDTGGSIRQPAALTGTVGMKPSYGSVSRYGAIALASSLDQIGPAARTVLDTALMHDVIVGNDVRDGASLNREWPSMVAAAEAGANLDSLKGFKVGLIKELDSDRVQSGSKEKLDATVKILTDLGAEIVEVSVPSLALASQAYYAIVSAEASSNLAKFDSVRFGLRTTPENVSNFEDVMSASRGEGFGAEVKRRILMGIHVLSKGQYDKIFVGAQKIRTMIINELEKAFESVDMVLSLTSPQTAWGLGESTDDAKLKHLRDETTVAANLAGLPALSVPAGLAADDQLPVGVQLLGKMFADDQLYKVGAVIEKMVTQRDGASVWQRIPEIAQEAR